MLDKEAKQAFDNLLLDCGPHHDIIDEPDRKAEFPAELLRSYPPFCSGD